MFWLVDGNLIDLMQDDGLFGLLMHWGRVWLCQERESSKCLPDFLDENEKERNLMFVKYQMYGLKDVVVALYLSSERQSEIVVGTDMLM